MDIFGYIVVCPKDTWFDRIIGIITLLALWAAFFAAWRYVKHTKAHVVEAKKLYEEAKNQAKADWALVENAKLEYKPNALVRIIETEEVSKSGDKATGLLIREDVKADIPVFIANLSKDITEFKFMTKVWGGQKPDYLDLTGKIIEPLYRGKLLFKLIKGEVFRGHFFLNLTESFGLEKVHGKNAKQLESLLSNDWLKIETHIDYEKETLPGNENIYDLYYFRVFTKTPKKVQENYYLVFGHWVFGGRYKESLT